jgi:hypothetical protein
LKQAHEDGGALPGKFAAGKQPCPAPHCPWPHQIFKTVDIDFHIAVGNLCGQSEPHSFSGWQGLWMAFFGLEEEQSTIAYRAFTRSYELHSYTLSFTNIKFVAPTATRVKTTINF